MKSKSVIIPVAVIIALSLLFIPLVQLSSSPAIFGSGGTSVLYYRSGHEYHFLAYSFNAFGQPVQGTNLNATLSASSKTYSAVGTTNSSGIAAWTAQVPDVESQLFYTLSVDGNVMVQGVFPTPPIDGQPGFFGGQILPFVTDPSNSSRTDILFFYEGPNGTLPTGCSVYYNFTNYSPGSGMGPTNQSQMTLLGQASGFVTTFKLPPVPATYNTVIVGAFDSNASMISESSSTSSGAPFTPPTPRSLFSSLSSSLLSFVVPLMAILVAYNAYGKDRASGVLESVLTRPVTRRGLSMSRYLAIVLSIVIGVTVSVGVMAVISQALLGATIPLDFATYTVLALAVEVAAFTGIMMLVALFVKSTGGMIGIGVILWVVLDFLWGIFSTLAALLSGVQLGSGDYLALSIHSSFVNPAQFYSLVGEYLNGISLVSGGASIPISPATYGLTPLTLAIAAAFWVVAPLGSFLYLCTRRD